MRSVTLLLLTFIGGTLLAGCATMPSGKPAATTIPMALPDLSLPAHDATGPAWIRQTIYLLNNDVWARYAGQIQGYSDISLAMQVTNTTTESPGVHLRYYLSARDDLTATDLAQTPLLLDAYLPCVDDTYQYDSGRVPLSPAIAQLLAGGRCFLYITGTPHDLAVHAAHIRLNLTARLKNW